MAFERLPGLNVQVPIQTFQPAQPRPVIPTAAIAEKFVEGLTKIIESGSPEERAKKQLQLAVLKKQLASIPLQADLERQVFENSKDTANFETTQVYTPDGVRMEVKPVSPEWKAATDPNQIIPSGPPTDEQVALSPTESGIEPPLPVKGDAESVEPPLLADPSAPPPAVDPRPLANMPDLVNPTPPVTTAPAAPQYRIPPGYTDLGVNPKDGERYAQGPDGTRVIIKPTVPAPAATAPAAPASTTGGAPGPGTGAAPAQAGDIPDFNEPPEVPPGYRLQRFGDSWRAINRSGHSYTIPSKWQRINEFDPASNSYRNVWVDSTNPTRRYDPGSLAKPTGGAKPPNEIIERVVGGTTAVQELMGLYTAKEQARDPGMLEKAALVQQARPSEGVLGSVIRQVSQAYVGKDAQQLEAVRQRVNAAILFARGGKALTPAEIEKLTVVEPDDSKEAALTKIRAAIPIIQREIQSYTVQYPNAFPQAAKMLGDVPKVGEQPAGAAPKAVTRDIGKIYKDNQGRRAIYGGVNTAGQEIWTPVP